MRVMNVNDNQQLILELTRFLDYDKEKIIRLLGEVDDFPYILGHLMYHRVAGIAYYTLQQCDLLTNINREFKNSLKTIFESNKRKNSQFVSGLKYLSKCFSKADFPYAFLKGSYLSLNLYPRGLRTSNDYDILIAQNDIHNCEEILRKNGFTQGKYIESRDVIIPATRAEIINSRMMRGETVPFVKAVKQPARGVLEVDINFSLDYKAKNESSPVANMLKATRPLQKNRCSLQTLGEEDFLIHICMHLYKEASVFDWVRMGRDLSLYKFTDIYAFLLKNSSKAFANRLCNKIHQYKLQKECYYTIQNTATLYPSLLNINGVADILKDIQPSSEQYLQEIIYPSQHKKYTHDLDFIDWFFTNNRISKLKEVY